MNDKFASGFAQDLESMVALKRALGYSENTYLERAKSFDRHCFEVYPGQQELTQAIVLSWLKPEPGKSPQTIHGKAAFVRALGKYQKSIGKAAYILPDRFTAGGTVFIPYLFGDDELAALFHEIDCYQYPRDPFRPLLLRTYFRMTYTCGLRPNEGRNLRRNEVDLNSGEVRIIETKWRKSRTIVMSEDMLSLARSYASIRDAAFPESAYFFPAPDGGPYSAQKMQGKFKWFFARIKPGIPKDLLPAVRVYDLRHRFATAVLNRWLDEKKELSSRLPYLQTYMGHKDWEATAYYIHLLPEKLVKSAGIDWEAMNGLIPRVELWEK